VEKFIRNFLAIGLGSFIGSEVALRVNGRFFWVGLILGGIFGYLSVDFREVLAAVRNAYKKIFSFKPTEIQKAFWLMVFMMSLNAGTFALIGFAADSWILPALDLKIRIVSVLVVFSIFTIFAGIFKGMFETVKLRDAGNLPEVDRAIDISTCRIASRYLSPVKAVTYWLMLALAYIGKGTLWGIRHFPAGLQRIGLFGKTVFASVHNDKRLVRLYYCAVGSGVGYVLGQPIAGFLVGGLIGAVCAFFIPRLLAPTSQETAP
jgi:hypothetical protein